MLIPGRFVVLILDEMKIQEDLVYDKTGQRLHGFVNLGDVNSDLQKLECQVAGDTIPSESIATHMLTLMVRGIFFKMEFPYANFPTQDNIYVLHHSYCDTHLGVTSHSLYWITWEAVRHLEKINLKVSIIIFKNEQLFMDMHYLGHCFCM